MTPGPSGWTRQVRRAACLLLVTAPLTAELASGSWVRVGRLTTSEQILYACLALGSVSVWALLLSLAGQCRHAWALRCAVGLGLGLVLGVHWLMWNEYSSVLTCGLLEQASRQGWDVRRTLAAAGTEVGFAVATPMVVLALTATICSLPERLKTWGRHPGASLVVLGIAVASLGPRTASRPADLAVLGSASAFVLHWVTGRVKPAAASPSVPWLPRLDANRVNVLLIVTESVRHDSYCNDPHSACMLTPVVQRAFPDRVPLLEMRSVASWTIQSLAVITTGLTATSSRSDFEHAPSSFDFARAAGRHTELLSSHKLSDLFLRSSGLDHVVSFDDLGRDPDCETADEDLAGLAGERLRTMPEPYFVLLQLGDTHAPYTVDPHDAPFVPYAREFSWAGTPQLRNQYRNAIHRQDRLLGQMLERLRASGRLERTVVLFTSDHGEAFREHSQLFHGGSLRDEEIHVATWIWVPEGLRRALGHRYTALGGRRADFVSHLDLLPTLLDIFGVLEEPALRPQIAALTGHSLLRPRPLPEPVALTNCNALMQCAFRTYGVLEDHYQLEAREWDGYWNCWDLSRPAGALDMASTPCQALLRSARTLHPRLPNGQRY